MSDVIRISTAQATIGDVRSEMDHLATAFADGREAGADPAGTTSTCPADHSWPALDRAWLDGFAAGRLDAELLSQSAASTSSSAM